MRLSGSSMKKLSELESVVIRCHDTAQAMLDQARSMSNPMCRNQYMFTSELGIMQVSHTAHSVRLVIWSRSVNGTLHRHGCCGGPACWLHRLGSPHAAVLGIEWCATSCSLLAWHASLHACANCIDRDLLMSRNDAQCTWMTLLLRKRWLICRACQCCVGRCGHLQSCACVGTQSCATSVHADLQYANMGRGMHLCSPNGSCTTAGSFLHCWAIRTASSDWIICSLISPSSL